MSPVLLANGELNILDTMYGKIAVQINWKITVLIIVECDYDVLL